MKQEREALELCNELGYLNKEGLLRYIEYLKDEVHNHSERIKEVVKEKGLHNR